ncbi:MAG: TIGR01777 family protein [Gammaproteobacteria bacterium]|nr:MAG: TIGR01777 family protein [Gammaproteobacteria bacterium]
MHRIITGATGLIGKRLVEYWLAQSHTVTVIGRSEQHIKNVFGTRVQAVTWDKLTREVLQSAELVVNLAGANIGEKRWTKARKAEVLDSRVNATRAIANLLAELGSNAPVLLNASAIGIYGLQAQNEKGLPPALDETTPIDGTAPDFLSLVGRQWEKAADPAVKAGVRVVFLRFAVVLAEEGGALPKLIQPSHLYLSGRIGTGYQPFSWVAIDDVIRAIDFLCARSDSAGPYNIVAPGCVPQRQFAEAVERVIQRKPFATIPAFVFKLLLGAEMARELLLEGQHAYPKRLLDLGFQFSYPDIEAALTHLLR